MLLTANIGLKYAYAYVLQGIKFHNVTQPVKWHNFNVTYKH